MATQLAQHADPDCTGTWSFRFEERDGAVFCTDAVCLSCCAVRAVDSPEEAGVYSGENLMGRLLTSLASGEVL
jgi:hypothetical protein